MKTRTNNTSPARFNRSRCGSVIKESFWLPSSHHGELIDAIAAEWLGGKYATARYECPCCGVWWSERWPVLLMLGPGWRRRYTPPIHLVAGQDGVPRHFASAFTPEGLLAG
jgi:hypothetical protein